MYWTGMYVSVLRHRVTHVKADQWGRELGRAIMLNVKIVLNDSVSLPYNVFFLSQGRHWMYQDKSWVK